MRKVIELKSNECIHCRTKEEYDAITDLFDKAGKRWRGVISAKDYNPCEQQNEGMCLFIDDGGTISYDPFTITKTQNYTIYPASDFISEFQWGDEVEVSDDGKDWGLKRFVSMNPIECGFPFIAVTENGASSMWKLCRKPQTERAKIEAQIKELQEKLKNL